MRVAIGYEGAPMAMTLEVYPSDAEAFEAAAALAAEHLRSTGARAAVALAGGRSGRGVMTALAARGDLPWERVEWFWGDERCVPADDGRSNLRLARDSLFVPRGVPAGRIHPPPVALGVLGARHGDEREAARLTRVAIGDDRYRLAGARLREQLAQLVLRDPVGEVADEELLGHLGPLLISASQRLQCGRRCTMTPRPWR